MLEEWLGTTRRPRAELMAETREKIFEELGCKIPNNYSLVNGRSQFLKEHSKYNSLISIINEVAETTTSMNKLNKMLEDLKNLNSEHKLDFLKGFDLEEALKEERLQEYNMTATRYGDLSNEEISQIDGIEAFEYDNKRFIVLNGAPFRFVGRSLDANSGKELTSAEHTEERIWLINK